MILENYIDWYTSDEQEREELKENAELYVREDHVDELDDVCIYEESMEKLKDIVKSANKEINWDNYMDEGETLGKEEYWNTGQVFYSQLEWVKENIPVNDNTEELFDYITEIQKACEAFNIIDNLIKQ